MNSTHQSITLPVNDTPMHIVVWKESKKEESANVEELKQRVDSLEKMVRELMNKIDKPSVAPFNSPKLRTVAEILQEERKYTWTPDTVLPKRSPYFTATHVPEPVGLGILHLGETVSRKLSVASQPEAKVLQGLIETVADEMKSEEKLNTAFVEEQVQEEVVEEEVVEEVQEEEVVEEEMVEEEVVEEEVQEEEQAMELEEFEYKGVTYYRDGENQVYELDSDGQLNDTPIGIWNEAKQKVLKYPK